MVYKKIIQNILTRQAKYSYNADVMIKKIIIIIFLLFSYSFSLELWLTIDKSQEAATQKLVKKYFPQANVTYFYWDTALNQITKKITQNKLPDVLLTGHTYLPFIAQYYSNFESVAPLYWDVRALYVWGDNPNLSVVNWQETLFFLQNHTRFMAFPNQWTVDELYNYLAFFNDQLPFWISTSPFSSQNLLYTIKLLTTLKKIYPALFKDKPVEAFLKKENEAIISGPWMYNILKKQKAPFTVFPVPKSQNGIQEFKGAYVGIFFNNDSATQKTKDILNSYKFQKDSWQIFNLLPTNQKLEDELYEDPILKVLIDITKSSRWASSVEPNSLKEKVDVLNFFLKKKNTNEKFNDKKILGFFNNQIYFKIMKWFN